MKKLLIIALLATATAGCDKLSWIPLTRDTKPTATPSPAASSKPKPTDGLILAQRVATLIDKDQVKVKRDVSAPGALFARYEMTTDKIRINYADNADGCCNIEDILFVDEKPVELSRNEWAPILAALDGWHKRRFEKQKAMYEANRKARIKAALDSLK